MDSSEFDDFYAATFRRVAAQVYALTGDPDEAEECAQEAFARAWAHRHRLERSGYPEAWVHTTAYRLAVSRWRRGLRSRRTPDRALQPAEPVAAPGPEHVVVVEALRQLPAHQRDALVLHHVCDLPVSAVASALGVPEGTVKARLSRGRAALHELFAEHPHDLTEGASRD
jgi:RNA polymerase sigma-70 factor (ECF subfamily)